MCFGIGISLKVLFIIYICLIQMNEKKEEEELLLCMYKKLFKKFQKA